MIIHIHLQDIKKEFSEIIASGNIMKRDELYKEIIKYLKQYR